MKQSPLGDTTKDLLAFYARVEPVLSKWLAKSLWTARETAALCAGYVPEDEDSTVDRLQAEIASYRAIDPLEYLQPDQGLYRSYRHLLGDHTPASPCDMVTLLRPAFSIAYTEGDNGGATRWIEIRRPLKIEGLSELQWLLIIGNAVGLQVPALVPFGLLNELRATVNVQSVHASASGRQTVAGLPPRTDSVSRGGGQNESRMFRQNQPPPMTAEQRGYHTTAEVAALTGLLPDTLNKYAREGRFVEGFTPFKRQNGKSWQWRDAQQQANYQTAHQVKSNSE
ncbi:hypothetical protein GJQ57_08750 [Ralstonia pickettii]|uniref:DNA-binding protein n=1 Tax=Ralstonia pickettii TaxID=329 RepID=A0A7X2HMP3_RALPI|nr:hypothetical protein [Ralstonia pickettii]MRS98744.1 hypothetical protein [Ralstonia pickettii]